VWPFSGTDYDPAFASVEDPKADSPIAAAPVAMVLKNFLRGEAPVLFLSIFKKILVKKINQ
jgi:hypothetical protein